MFQFESALLSELAQMEVMEFDPGTVILKENDFIRVVPLILEGSIKLRKQDPTGREVIFYHIEAGESCILSITSCLNEKGSQAEAIIQKKTRLLAVDAGSVRKWMEEYPTWRRFVVRLYYDRMAELMTLVDHVIFKSVDTRLIAHLKAKAVDGVLESTHQRLAGELGTAREVISRLLKQLEKEGKITLERGKIRISGSL